MAKFYAPSLRVKKFLFLMMGFFTLAKLTAQTDISIGTGTTGNAATLTGGYPCPIQDYYEGSRAQYLYLASELNTAGIGAGNINAIKFNITSLNGFSGDIQEYTIKISTTSSNTLSAAAWETVTTTVYGPVNYVPAAGVNTFAFSNPFFWNGTSNIVIEICNGLATNATGTHWTQNPTIPWTTGLSFNGSHTYIADNLGNLCGTATTTNSGPQTTRPNITFNWTPAAACTGIPNAGTATATPGNVCVNQPITLASAGVTVASGLSYQWQVSTNSGGTWASVAGATSISSIATQSVTSQYRFRVICTRTGGTDTAYSNTVTVTSPPIPNGDYTISKDTATNYPTGRNFNSFNDAYNAIKCGINGAVRFNVITNATPYNEQLIINGVIPGSSAANTITFRGNGATIGFSSANSNERAVFKLKNTKFFIFDSLTVNASAGTYGYGFHLLAEADSNVVRRCTINSSLTSTAQNFAGIVINGADAGLTSTGTVLADGNRFTKNLINGGYYGVVIASTFSGGASGFNKIDSNDIRESYAAGVYLAGVYNTLVEANTIHRPARTAVTNFDGILLTAEKCTNTLINRNRIKNPFGGAPTGNFTFNGINFNNADGSVGSENFVTNNVIYNANGNGAQTGISNTGSDYVYYLHNTISLDYATSTSTSTTRGFYQNTTASGVSLYNNIISVTRGGTGTKHVVYLATSLLVDMNNNDYYINAPGTTNYIGFYTSNRATLANWQAATNMEAQSLSINPAFLDPANENYSPGNAALDNKGIYTTLVDFDINNTPRSTTTPDVGAYEFTPPPCSTPPVTGTTTLSVSTICEGNPVFLSLNIGAYGSAQTFQWQTSTTSGGTYTSFGSPMLTPDTTILASQTLYYRAAVTCGSTTVYTTPVLLTVNPRLPGGTYTIDFNNSTTYTGPATGTNFKTFADAKTAMSCGITGAVVFNVVPGSGPYNEKLTLGNIPGSSAASTITFKGNGNTITATSTVTTDRAVIKLNGARHITFDSLNVDAGTGTFGFGIQLINDADSNVIKRCTVTSPSTGSANYAGIVINASDASAVTAGNTLCDFNRIDSNTVVGGFYGITLVGGTTAATYINDNKITNNVIRDFYSTGFQVTGTNNSLVEKNLFTRPTLATSSSVVFGINATTNPSPGLRISKNRFTGFYTANQTSTSTTYAVYHNSVSAAAGGENIVSNNLIYTIGGNGQSYGLYNIGSNNVRYYHNTISFDETGASAVGQTVGFYQNTAATGLEFVNNIINIRRGGSGLKYAIYLGVTTTEIVANYNDYYVNGSGGNNYIGFYSGNRLTLADWKTISSKDANSFNIDPLFISPSTGDYRPGIISLDNKGINNTGITTDILGVNRGATPDMGAFEFVAPSCVNPPVAGTTVVTPASGACLESRIFLTLSGNSPVGSLTFQWQSSANGTAWTNLSGILYTPDYDTLVTVNRYYRAAVTCNGVTTFSTPFQITLGNILPAGVYTIGNGATTYPATGSNFQTFGEAVNAMLCGIGGKVTFNVATGTYNEQIRIPYIPGTSLASTVTFQAANGNAASATLTTGANTATANYTLKLDSTRNFIFRNLGFASTGTTFGRVVEFAATASNDTLTNCIVTAPVTAVGSNNVAGFYAAALKGTRILIKNNTVNNGAYGIFFTGTGASANLTEGHVIDSNTVVGAYNYGIYATFQKAVKLRGNTVDLSGALATTGYGIYASDCDSSFEINNNKVRISNTATSVYGLYLNNSDSSLTTRGQLYNNIITSSGVNTGTMYGLYTNNSHGHNAINNVVSLNNTGTISYGLFTNSAVANYWNNTVNTTATATTNGFAAYIQNSATALLSFRNNIFSNMGGGRSMYAAVSSQTNGSDYNMLYTSGTVLVQRGSPAGTFANLAAWRTGSFWDLNSIVYKPAFTGTNLQPNLANDSVWAMHGRGVHIGGNDRDINNQTRPTILTAGVPDLGAYEFFPSVQPTVLTGTPATPAANATQVFMYGTDTVAKVTWGATFPPDVTAQRFSGVPPSGNKPSPDSMFFYTQFNSSTPVASRNFPLKMDLFYIDPWQGSIQSQYQIGLGRTTPSNAWVVGFNSRTDVRKKVITETGLSFFDKFTGFVNPYAPPVLPDKDSSNRGRRFWVAYPVNQLAGGQEMVLYLSAQETANVQVKINGTTWLRNYTVPANTVTVSDLIPKAGADNAFINVPGQSNRGISIESDVPIVAYAHVYGSASSGASMLMPVGVWGYEYKTLGITQDYGLSSFAYYYVIADNDGTTVEINSTPGIAVQNAGMTAGTPYTITLNKGEFYQVVATSQTEELSGSSVKSVPNAQGKCYPIAVFSGSSRTAIDVGCGSGGDFIMQQNFPSTAWGRRYLTAPSSTDASASAFETNIYRIAVKDPTTIVKRNGVVINAATLQRSFYYEYQSSTADYIEADKPIMIAQFLAGSCGVNGDPEMIYISPIEQGIDKIAFYRNTQQAIVVNYLTLIVPKGGTGLSSLVITDGTTVVAPDHTYDHPNLAGYRVVVKRWIGAQQQVRVQSDSAFTAITYGQGSVESYGYNAGTLVRNLNSLGLINNTLSASGNSTEFTCVGSPFKFTALLPLIPTELTWKFSAVPGLTPNADVTIANPVPTGSIIINRTTYYQFPVATNYTFATPGVYGVQISYKHPDIESCDKTRNDVIYVQVLPSPKTNFTITPPAVCEGGTVQFAGDNQTENGVIVNNWTWTFHTGATATGRTTSFTYPTAGNFDVKLRTITPDGCIGDSTKKVLVNPRPTVNVVADLITLCTGRDTILRVLNPVAGVTYSWYTVATGGTSIATGTSLPLTNITTSTSYYVEAVSAAGCTSTLRKKADINVLPLLATPVVTVSAVTPNSITFSWQPVNGAATYQVSTDNGVTFTAPSSGANGTTHTINGLNAFQEVKLLVRAFGSITCQTSPDGTATGRTISSEVFIPNSFSPNGDGLNDKLMVYGYGIKDMQFTVFNQWGTKIFESRIQTTGWDGSYQGKMQPSGVYIYVAKFTLLDGTVIDKKGSINLIR